MSVESGLLILLLLACIAILALVYEARPKGPKIKPFNHHHRGQIRSQHEQQGRPAYVYECQVCHLHFTGIH